MYLLRGVSDITVKEVIKAMVVIRLPYRHTFKTDAVTRCHVLTLSGEELKPVYERRSRTGAHGEDVYDIDQTVYVIEYNRSGSGHESISVYTVDEKGYRHRFDANHYPQVVLDFLAYEYPEWRYF